MNRVHLFAVALLVVTLFSERTIILAVREGEENKSDVRHIVFFGDSLMRYEYLTFVHDLHFGSSRPVPPYLINQNVFHGWADGWVRYFKNSTDTFEGAMTCDCYRHTSLKKIDTMRENRRYAHPSGKLIVSYYAYMANVPFKGMTNQSRITNSFGKYVEKPDWFYTSPFAFTSSHLAHDAPTPSIVFVNSGHWYHHVVAKNPIRLLRMLEDVVKRSQNSACVAWLATTKPKIPWLNGSRDADWNILKGKYCHKSLSDGRTEQHDSSGSKVQMLNYSVFVPFDIKTKPSDYFDHMHFINANIYRLRTERALNACSLKNISTLIDKYIHIKS